MSNLNERQAAFVRQYTIDPNATQAALKAGYSEKTAHAMGCRLLKNVKVKKELARLRKERTERTNIDADYVLRRCVEIDEMDVSDILTDEGAVKPVSKWPKVWRTSISGLDIQEIFNSGGGEVELAAVVKKLKMPDKQRNLEMLGKHVDVQAFNERREVEVSGNLSIMTDEELERIAASGSK